jgi:hypothetical protein
VQKWPPAFSGRFEAIRRGIRLATDPRQMLHGNAVYLFVRTPADGPGSVVGLRRLKAMQTLRDELRALQVVVAAAPQQAVVHVEITNVFSSNDSLRADGRRILLVRVSAGDAHSDFVCADEAGGPAAERQAAHRICGLIERAKNAPSAYPGNLPNELRVRASTC